MPADDLDEAERVLDRRATSLDAGRRRPTSGDRVGPSEAPAMSPLAAGSRLGRYRDPAPARRRSDGRGLSSPRTRRSAAGSRSRRCTSRRGAPSEIEERKRRLLREARAAGKLLHPNIVALFDVGEDQGMLYLAFECVDGSDLSQRLAEGPPLSLGEALGIVRQAAEALDYAHRQGVVHRDIKPSNLMITRGRGSVKVADFGIAKVIDQTSRPDDDRLGGRQPALPVARADPRRGARRPQRHLLARRRCSTRCSAAGARSTARRSPRWSTRSSTRIRRRSCCARPDLGPRLEALVQRMLHKDRDQRFASAGEVAREIAACERELAPALLAAAGRARTRPRSSQATRPHARAPAPAPAGRRRLRASAAHRRPSAPPPPPPAPPAGAGAASAAPVADGPQDGPRRR